MPKVFAHLFTTFSILEDAFGVSELGAKEREVFRFVANAFANDEVVTRFDVLAARIATRSSAYRHLDTLERRGLIVTGPDLSLPEIRIHPRLAAARRLLKQQVKAGAWTSVTESAAKKGRASRRAGV